VSLADSAKTLLDAKADNTAKAAANLDNFFMIFFPFLLQEQRVLQIKKRGS
jgi:hypothetical protein